MHAACACAVEADAHGNFDAAKAVHLACCRAHELPPEPAPGAPYGAAHIAFGKALDRVLVATDALTALLEVPPPGSIEPYFAMPAMCYLPVADIELVEKRFALLEAYTVAREAHALLLSQRQGLRAIMAECPPPPTETSLMQLVAYSILKSEASAKKANKDAHQRIMQSPTASSAAKFNARLAEEAAVAAEAAEAAAAVGAEGGGGGGGVEGEGDNPASASQSDETSALSRLVAEATAAPSAPQLARAHAAAAASAAAAAASAAAAAGGDRSASHG